MARQLRTSIALTLALAVSAFGPADDTAGVPYVEGPDVPTYSAADAVVTPFADERWSFTEGARWRTIDVPALPPGATDGAWDRVYLVFSSRTDGDPWDRLFGVSIGDVEVLRGTTPRTAFTVRKDITEYASLLVPGDRVPVGMYFATWVGAMHNTVRLEFYDDEPVPAARPEVDRVVGSWVWRGPGGNPKQVTTTSVFPDTATGSAVAEFTLSGHGADGEFWYLSAKPATFHLKVDGDEVMTVTALPYVYALAGTNGNNGDNGPIWWSAHRYLDQAGVHHGVGPIPPYRAILDADEVAKLRGAKTVELIQETGAGYWPGSVSFLLDGVSADNCPDVENPDQADADGDGIGDACDGPRIAAADGTASVGDGHADVVTLNYDRAVTCDDRHADEFTYNGVAALSAHCDGTATVRLSFPDSTLRAISHGRLTYQPSASPVRGGGESATVQIEPVLVS